MAIRSRTQAPVTSRHRSGRAGASLLRRIAGYHCDSEHAPECTDKLLDGGVRATPPHASRPAGGPGGAGIVPAPGARGVSTLTLVMGEYCGFGSSPNA
jgi:hypothetical protein